MTDELIRGLNDAALARIDAEAAALGVSRTVFLRRRLEVEDARSSGEPLAEGDWHRSAATFGDLADPAVMEAAWRDTGVF